MDDNWIEDLFDFIKPIETVVVDGIVWEKYEIDVTDDLYSDPDKRWEYASYVAHDKCEFYIVPCEWEMISDNGSVVTLLRKYRKQEKT